MHVIILEAVAIARDILIALADAVLLRTSARFEHSLLVSAPRDTVWAVASARNITFDGKPQIIITSLPSPEAGIEVIEMRSGDMTWRIGLRAVETNVGVGQMHEVVPQYTDAMVLASGLTHAGFGLVDTQSGTRLTMLQQGGRVSFAQRINTRIGLRLMGRRIAAASEAAAAMRPAARKGMRAGATAPDGQARGASRWLPGNAGH